MYNARMHNIYNYYYQMLLLRGIPGSAAYYNITVTAIMQYNATDTCAFHKRSIYEYGVHFQKHPEIRIITY